MPADCSGVLRAASISVKLLVGGDESVELGKTTVLASQKRDKRIARLTAETAIILRGGKEFTRFVLL